MVDKRISISLFLKHGIGRQLDEEALEADKASAKMSKAFNEKTSKFGKGLSSLGSKLEGMDVVGAGGLVALGDGLEHTSIKFGKLKSVVGQASKYMSVGILGVAGVVGAFSVHASDAYASANNSLKASISASGESFSKYKDQIAGAEGSYTKFGFSATDVDNALATSVISTQNVKTSLSELSVAADIAAVKHTSLASATTMVNKAMVGGSRVLKQFGIDLKIPGFNAEKLYQAQVKLRDANRGVYLTLQQYHGAEKAGSKDHYAYLKATDAVAKAQEGLRRIEQAHTVVLKALTDRFAGQASAAANTYQGHLKELHAEITNVGIKIGNYLVPVLDTLLRVGMSVFNFLIHNKPVLIALAVIAGGILAIGFATWVKELKESIVELFGLGEAGPVAGEGLAAAGEGADVAAEGVEGIGAAMASTGIALLIIGISIALYELFTHWRTVWGVLKEVGLAAWHFIDNNIVHPLMSVWNDVVMPPLKAFMTFWRIEFDGWKAIILGAWHFVQDNIILPLEAVWDSVVIPALRVFSDIWGDVFDTIRNVALGVWHFIDNWVIHPFEKAFTIIGNAVKWAWTHLIQPTFAAIEKAAGLVVGAINRVLGIAKSIGGALSNAFGGTTVPTWLQGMITSGKGKLGLEWTDHYIKSHKGWKKGNPIPAPPPNWKPGAAVTLDGMKVPNFSTKTPQLSARNWSGLSSAIRSAMRSVDQAKSARAAGAMPTEQHTYHITIQTGADPRAVMAAVKKYARQNGSLKVRTSYNAPV